MNKIDDILKQETAPHELALCIHGVSLSVRSDDAAALQAMRRDYHQYIEEIPTTPRYQLWVLELDPDQCMPADRSAFNRYVLGDGRSKHPFLDDGEVRYVVRHGSGRCVIFDDHRYVVLWSKDAPHDQISDLIKSIYMREMVERGYTVVHCAGLEADGVGFALAGRAGAGKTTTMMKVVAAGGTYISNDRLMVRRESASDWFEMRGVIKWPRVCAGTMYGDPRLRELLPADAAARYHQMPFEELVSVGDKYDVNLDSAYGPGRVKDTGRCRRMYCLTWSRQQEGFAIERVDTRDDAFWDDFGPSLARDASVFDRRQRSSLWTAEKKELYRRNLEGIEMFAITGKLDFDRIADALLDHVRQPG